MNVERLKEDLIRDEGVRLKPYVDIVGKTTIGVGRNLTDVGITLKEAEIMLDSDIERVESDLDLHLAWWTTLDEPRQRVLANMCFNLGIAGLLGFKNTLRAIQEGRYADAAKGMLDSKWAAQVGVRANRLAHTMENG